MSEETIAALCGAIAGAVMGGLVGFILELVMEKKRRRSALSDQLIDQAFDFNAQVSSYWSVDGRDLQAEAMILSGFNRIKARLVALEVDLGPGSVPRRLLKEIHQFATGAGFATVGKVAEPSRAREVSGRVDRLVGAVRR